MISVLQVIYKTSGSYVVHHTHTYRLISALQTKSRYFFVASAGYVCVVMQIDILSVILFLSVSQYRIYLFFRNYKRQIKYIYFLPFQLLVLYSKVNHHGACWKSRLFIQFDCQSHLDFDESDPSGSKWTRSIQDVHYITYISCLQYATLRWFSTLDVAVSENWTSLQFIKTISQFHC